MRLMREMIAMVSQGLNAMKARLGFWIDPQPPREPAAGPPPSAADRERLLEERDLLLLRQMPR
ncbi:MAG: hypothetical protein J0H01_25030 [Rhizobiales bacterium]|nr:hypothetical protein [Hyphomicrobiales bacterium]